jgi:hypothetical protein
VNKILEFISRITLVDIAIVVSLGLSIVTRSPALAFTTVALVLIREAKDTYVVKDVDKKLNKMEMRLNELFLADEERADEVAKRLNKVETSVEVSLKSNKADIEAIKNEVNRVVIKTKDVIGNW